MQKNIKTQKTDKGMGKKILLYLSIFFSLLSIIPLTNAVQYYQYSYPLNDSHTTKIYAYVIYPLEDRIVRDRVNEGFLYEYAIKFDLYPEFWNSQSPNLVQYCQINITTQKYYSLLNGIAPQPIIQEYYQRISDTNLYNQEFYVSLSKGDTSYIELDCYFTNSSLQSMTIPANLYIQTPTFECEQCKKYEWSKIQPTLYKADFLQQSNVNNIEYIKKIVFINFEFYIIIYWIILILIVLFAVGMIFMGAYWFYLILKKHIR